MGTVKMSHSRLGLADAWGNLRSVRFNQDMTAVVCAFEDGLRIFNIDPIREQAHYKEDQVGSIAHAEMLYRTNLVAMVSVDTRDNPLGLCEVSPQRCGEREVMVFPGYKTGSIQMVDLSTTEQRVSSAPVSVNAHKNELVCLAINQQGTMVATASTKGTLIRIWDTARRIQLVELRRGADQARIYCINFSSSDEWLCCSSDKGTVHVFALQDYRLNKRSALASIGVPGAYAGSQWSLASFTVPQECACICAFVGQ